MENRGFLLGFVIFFHLILWLSLPLCRAEDVCVYSLVFGSRIRARPSVDGDVPSDMSFSSGTKNCADLNLPAKTESKRCWRIWRRTIACFSLLFGPHSLNGLQATYFQKLHETSQIMSFMRSLYHYYTQINPLENWGHTVWIDYKQKNPKFAQNLWGNGFYEVPFPLLHTNHHLGKRGAHSLYGL